MLTELAGWVKWNGVIKWVGGYVCKTFYVIESKEHPSAGSLQLAAGS